MIRIATLGLLVPVLSFAALLPESIGPYQRTASAEPALADQPLWSEYGLKGSETAEYEGAGSKFTATAWQLQDATGALAAFYWQRPADAAASDIAALSAEAPGLLLLVHGNYLLLFKGYKPTTPELDALVAGLKNVDSGSLPTLRGFLPDAGLIPNSERYLTGPVALERFEPGVPPSVAAFSLGAEAILGNFRSAKGQMTLAVFNYPTPQIAMQKVEDFQKLGGRVKRTGPLIGIILNPPDPDAAERLLGELRYQAEVTRDERIPTRRDNIGDLVINAFVLIGILLAFSVVSGFAVGGFRSLVRRLRKTPEPEAMITLHLEER